MSSGSPLTEVLDAQQLARIEAVHRGFLYQHLYAVGCLLLAGGHFVRQVRVELDEDVELVLADGSCLYMQIKDRAGPLVYSQIDGAIRRFEAIRGEHLEKRRGGAAQFAVVSSSAPGLELMQRIQAGELPADILFVWPGSPASLPACMPPAWLNLASAIGWCEERASQLFMSTVSPLTLVWKLAGLVQAASTGQTLGMEAARVSGHVFRAEELPDLFEQLVVQLQQFPEPPAVYRAVQDEPLFTSEHRVRVITGFSGAGKTAWAAQTATHSPGEMAYYDVGDVPGPAIAASLARELAAHWVADSAEGLRSILSHSRSGLESLRALDKFLGENGARALVVLDNAHRVPAGDLRMLVEATHHLQMVLLAQPTGSIAQFEALTGIRAELLKGWDLDQAAAEVRAQGARASAPDLGRLLAVTGGLPLYVRAAVQLGVQQYDGEVVALCTALEASTHLEATPQDVILSGVFDSLPEQVRDCVAVLSLSDVPLGEHEASGLIRDTLGVGAPGFAAAIRQLLPLGVVRMFSGKRLQIHDAMRLLGRRRFDALPLETTQAALAALMDVIYRSFEVGKELSRLPLFVRTLIELGRLDLLTDMANEEWFHELDVGEGVWLALEAAAENPSIEAKIRFDALDALAFAASQAQNSADVRRYLLAMEPLLSQHDLGQRRPRVHQLKKTMLEAEGGDEAATRRSIERLCAITPADPANQRVLSYSVALALFKLNRHAEVLEIIEPLIAQYCLHLGFPPLPLLSRATDDYSLQLPDTDTVVDDVKHLADALDMFAQSRDAMHLSPGHARLFSAYFYRAVNMLVSFVKLGQDFVRELLGKNAPDQARAYMEEQLLATVVEHKMHALMVSVRSQYALVLGMCRDFDGAEAEFHRLDHYAHGLKPNQRSEIANQRQAVAQMRVRDARRGGRR